MTTEDCAVCLIPCDPAIHAATKRLHKWWRAHLKLKLAAIVPETPKHRELGDPPANKRDDLDIESIARMRAAGMTLKQIAAKCHCSIDAVTFRLQQANGEQDRKRTGAA